MSSLTWLSVAIRLKLETLEQFIHYTHTHTSLREEAPGVLSSLTNDCESSFFSTNNRRKAKSSTQDLTDILRSVSRH